MESARNRAAQHRRSHDQRRSDARDQHPVGEIGVSRRYLHPAQRIAARDSVHHDFDSGHRMRRGNSRRPRWRADGGGAAGTAWGVSATARGLDNKLKRTVIRAMKAWLLIPFIASIASAQIIVPTPKAGEPFEIRIE